MKKSWMVAGLVIAVVVAVGVFMLTTKNANDTKRGDDSATGNAETVKQTEMDTSVNFVPSSEAGGEKEWLAGYAEENLSAPVLALLGLDGKLHDYNSLLSAIAMLPKGNIAADDVAALRDMLTWPNDQFPEGMREIEINSIKNDVLDRLLRQKVLPEAMGYQLVDMFADTESDPVWKDYCVQFMSGFYEKQSEVLGVKFQEGQSGGSGSVPTMDDTEVVPPNDELDAVRETMIHALDERNETIAGTALIGDTVHVEFLVGNPNDFDWDGQPNALDDDWDNDMVINAIEASNGTGTFPRIEYQGVERAFCGAQRNYLISGRG